MTTLLNHAKAHFQTILQQEGLKCLQVPEWGKEGEPAKIYFKPLSSLPIKTYSQLVSLGMQQNVESFVDILILRCLDENANPLFKPLDKTEMLRHISPVVVCEIVKQMSDVDKESSVTLEMDAKNG